MKRRSDTGLPSNTEEEFNLQLFENALKDPKTRNHILHLLGGKKKSVLEFLKSTCSKDAASTPSKKAKKKVHCESPTALVRRRELEKLNRPTSAQSNDSEQSEASSSVSLPFQKILKGVVAYVEITCKGVDRSSGAKALLRSMGAIVVDYLSKSVTHVIFKDGLYETYLNAKLLKVHFVSVLWLEFSRRSGIKASEKSYPALGTENYDHNVSFICSQMQKDYEDVIREEVKRNLESGNPLPTTKTSVNNRRRTIASSSMLVDNNRYLQDPVYSSDKEVQSILSEVNSESPYQESRPSSLVLEEELQSDSFSECGMIDGEFSDKIVDDSFDSRILYQSNKNVETNMEFTCASDTDDSESRSLISGRHKRKSTNVISSKEFNTPTTENHSNVNTSSTGILQNIKGSLLNSFSYFTSKAPILTGKNSILREESEKENTSNDDELHNLKTPVLQKKSKKIDYPESAPNNVEYNLKTPVLQKNPKKIDLPKNTSNGVVLQKRSKKVAHSNNIPNDNELSSLKTPISQQKSKKVDHPLQVNLGQNEDAKETDMSSLRISNSSKEQSSSKDNKTGSTEMSSLRVSLGSNRTTASSNRTARSSMSSLKLSAGESSISSNCLRISSDHKDNDNTSDSPVIIKGAEKKKIPVIINEKSQEAQPTQSTPFVTERKRKKVVTTNVELIKKNVDTKNVVESRSENSADNSAETPKNSRRSRRETLALKEEKGKFEKDLKNRNIFHDRNKEVELSKKIAKSAEKTPKTFKVANTSTTWAVCNSPFVDTRPRGRSAKRRLEEEQDEQSSRSSSLRRNLGIIDEESSTYGKNQNEKQHSETSSLQKSKNEEKYEKRTKFPITILQNELVSPEKSISIEKKRTRRSIRLMSNNENTINKNSNEPQAIQKDNRLSRINSEPAIKIRKNLGVRKSKRMRKLYDPDAEDIYVNNELDDEKEIEELRQEKIKKMQATSPNTYLSGNLILTEKALEFLEKAGNDKKEINNSQTMLESKLGKDKKQIVRRKRETILDLSSDKQVDLIDEFVHKKQGLVDKIATQATPANKTSNHAASHNLPSTYPRSKSTRRSTLDFQPTSQRSTKIKAKPKPHKKPTIVCTKMHKSEVQLFGQIVRKLGVFDVEDEVSSRTTHLVAGEPKRTINMMRGIARGCWILSQDWLLTSLENNKWLPEDKYELTQFSPAVQRCRLERKAFGASYTMNVFLNCGTIYVANSTTPRCSDLQELIKLCGGKISRNPDSANIAIGAYLDGSKCVNEYWVLDSIQAGKLKSYRKYKISKQTKSWVTKSPFV